MSHRYSLYHVDHSLPFRLYDIVLYDIVHLNNTNYTKSVEFRILVFEYVELISLITFISYILLNIPSSI